MSIYDKDLLSGLDKIETAIERLRFNCKNKKVLCAFSGGKDSQCCYHLLKDAGIQFHAQYSITRFEPPELMQFIRENYPDVTFRRAYRHSLVEEIGDIGLPNRWFRWCCKAKHTKTPGFDITVIGVRASESSRRASSWRTFGRKNDGSYYVCPIFDWTEADVWEYLNGKGLPHCSLYDEGNKRIGCVCCPLVPSRMRADAARWPKIAQMLFMGHLKNWDKAVNNKGKTKRGKSYKMLEHGTARAAFEHWLDYGMTIKSDKRESVDEPCLFAGTGFSESDGMDSKEDEQ